MSLAGMSLAWCAISAYAGPAIPDSLIADSAIVPPTDSAINRCGLSFITRKKVLTPIEAALGRTRLQAVELLRAGRYAEAWNLGTAIAAEFPGEPFLLFWPEEEATMALITRRWDVLLETGRWNREFSTYLEGKAAPDDHGIRDSLENLFHSRATDIRADLDREALPTFQQEFLRLVYLDRLRRIRFHRARMGTEKYSDSGFQNMEALANAWLKRYPDKPYASTVRYAFRQGMQPALLGAGCDIIAGYHLPFGGLGKRLVRNSVVGVGAELMVWRLSLRAQAMRDGFADLDRDLEHGGRIWEEDGDYALAYAELQAGAELWRSVKIRVVPFVSWGGAYLTNRDLETIAKKEDQGFDDAAGSVWGYGIRVDRFFTRGFRPSEGYFGFSIGMRHPRWWRDFPGMSGGEAFLEARLGYSGRGWMRVP